MGKARGREKGSQGLRESCAGVALRLNLVFLTVRRLWGALRGRAGPKAGLGQWGSSVGQDDPWGNCPLRLGPTVLAKLRSDLRTWAGSPRRAPSWTAPADTSGGRSEGQLQTLARERGQKARVGPGRGLQRARQSETSVTSRAVLRNKEGAGLLCGKALP